MHGGERSEKRRQEKRDSKKKEGGRPNFTSPYGED